MSKKIYKNILFNEDRDKDILEFLQAQENQAKTVRDALRAYMDQDSNTLNNEVTLEDVMEKIEELTRHVSSIKMVSENSKNDEPQDIVNKLKNFGKLK